MVTFFDGKPEEQASLVYDEMHTTKDGSRALWRLAPDAPRGYSLVCAYEKTGNNNLARQQLERVLKMDPNYSEANEVKKQLAQLKS